VRFLERERKSEQEIRQGEEKTKQLRNGRENEATNM
jgi:hypothetical protein